MLEFLGSWGESSVLSSTQGLYLLLNISEYECHGACRNSVRQNINFTVTVIKRQLLQTKIDLSIHVKIQEKVFVILRENGEDSVQSGKAVLGL